MLNPDLNLLITLDVLLAEGSVARAAQRLRLSPSAMSRALALRQEVSRLVQDAGAVLRPVDVLDVEKLDRTFTIRASDGFVENFGADLLQRIGREAPGVRLRFMQKPDKDSKPLRDGAVDLELGVIGDATGPELRVQALFRDRFVGVVRPGHPIAEEKMTPPRYVAERHILVSRRGLDRGPIDDALAPIGLSREIATTVGTYSAALALARDTDLIAGVPELYTGRLRAGLYSFPLPVDVPPITISLIWHPRMDADPAHRWLRILVRQVCTQSL